MPGINFNPGKQDETQRAEPMTRRLIQVLFDELLSSHNNSCTYPFLLILKFARGGDDGERARRVGVIGAMGSLFAMSERNLARLIVKETGLSFASGVSSYS